MNGSIYEIDSHRVMKLDASYEMDLSRMGSVYNEMVFVEGRKTLAPIENKFAVIKDELEQQVKTLGNRFEPFDFARNTKWRDLELAIQQIFGFKNVSIIHPKEYYVKRLDDFNYVDLTAFTYVTWRYPIDGLVTEKGFYDKSHSINMDMTISLQLIRLLQPSEIVASFLHEFGHNIDPCMVDIKYVKTNVLAKYLTDRKEQITEMEQKIASIGAGIIELFTPYMERFRLFDWIKNLLGISGWSPEQAIERVRQLAAKDASQNVFNRQTNKEAFADNIARMYGYGAELARVFATFDKYAHKRMKSWIKKEEKRQQVIADIALAEIEGEHKTDIHRVRALIQEYETDLADPNIPAAVKKSLAEDLSEVKQVLNYYLNHKDKFQKNVNRAIYDTITSVENNIPPSNTPAQ